MKYRRLLSAFFIFLIPALAQAEYRVFLLKIAKRAPAAAAAPAEADAGPGFRLVESTLDPEQYRSFYPVALDEDISYIATWRCYGRTDGMRPHCPNPKGQIPSEESPAP
ncbi:hypothetical protein [Bdellovibrio sp. HCB209]|uniref:hypothetical protein n=1 Tax=Bdellovibrio sp. HCB209 TaxID=3394354 RepID=UPI0039B41DCB